MFIPSNTITTPVGLWAVPNEGVTLRDLFALAYVNQRSQHTALDMDEYTARSAYKFADRCLEARDRTNG